MKAPNNQGTHEIISAFLRDRQAQGLSPGTLHSYREKLGKLTAFCELQGIADIFALSAHDIREYLLWLEEIGHNEGGRHACYRAAKTLLRWCWEEWELETPNPISKVRAPKLTVAPIEGISFDDVKALLATCATKGFHDCRDKAIILSLLDTGCRANELLDINLDDLDEIAGVIVIRRGKGGKTRTVFIGAQARRAVRRYLRTFPPEEVAPVPGAPDRAGEAHRDGRPLWRTPEGTRLTYYGLREIMRRRAARAGVPCPGLHDFRRTFALTCLRNGVDTISLQRLLGHSSLAVLERYLAQTTDDLRNAHARAGVVDGLFSS
ncbi:MAG: site-specific tyrosine recombinase XerD [Anaerolineae bacterium]